MIIHFHGGHAHHEGEPNKSNQPGHHHHHHHSTKGIKAAFFLNLTFAIVELIGGILTNSVAILSDAIHDIGDAAAIGLAWGFENFSKKESNQRFTYGYGRLSIISALITSVILLSGSIFIIAEAVPRLFKPEAVDSGGMILLGVLGVIVNGAAVFNLKKEKSSSLNQKAILLHLMEDVLGWVAVLAGSIIMYFTDWVIIDPILSLGISAYILFNVFKMLKSITKVLLQATPEGLDTQDIKSKLIDIDGVSSVHDMHVWTLDNEYHILSLHLVMDSGSKRADTTEIKSKAREILLTSGINHSTIEIEYPEEDCAHHDCV